MNPNITNLPAANTMIFLASLDFIVFMKEGTLFQIDLKLFEHSEIKLKLAKKEGRNEVTHLGKLINNKKV